FMLAGTTSLVASMLRGLDVDPSFLQRLQETTKGNAFFVTETMRAFIEQGALTLEGSQWRTAKPASQLVLPGSIADVVKQRLQTLTPETGEFCRRLAPLGRVLELPIIREISNMSDERLFAVL